MSSLKVIPIAVGPLETNCYIVPGAGGKCALIDPGFSADLILSEADRRGLSVEGIMLTHGHFDHFFAAAEIIKKTGAPLTVPAGDAALLAAFGLGALFVAPEELPRYAVKPDRLAGDGDVVTLAEMEFRYMHTPGHTPGSSCILIKDAVFAGDTILFHGPGRTDLEGSDETAIRRSYRERLCPLPDELIVYPGHGSVSSIAEERRKNPYFDLP